MRGVTLIETLVYLALFTISIGSLVVAAYAFIESTGRNHTRAMIGEEVSFLTTRIEGILTEIDKAQPILYGATLHATTFHHSMISIGLTGKNIWLNSPQNILNNSNVTVQELSFIHKGGTNATDPERIEFMFTVEAHAPNGMILTDKAKSTVYLQP